MFFLIKGESQVHTKVLTGSWSQVIGVITP